MITEQRRTVLAGVREEAMWELFLKEEMRLIIVIFVVRNERAMESSRHRFTIFCFTLNPFSLSCGYSL